MNTSEERIRYAIEHADGWVIRNLKKHYNSVFPSSLLTCEDDVRIGEKLLSCIMSKKVNLRKTDDGWIAEI